MLAIVPISVSDFCAFAIDNGMLSAPTDSIIAPITTMIDGLTGSASLLFFVIIKKYLSK
jgi:hypothetical protein